MSTFHSRGFSLFELVIVLFLSAMVAGLIAPDLLGRIRRTRGEEFAHRLTVLMREAYASAVFSGEVRWIVLEGPEEDRRITIRNDFPIGSETCRLGVRPLLLPEWIEVVGLENGWCARPEGFCDEGPVVIRDSTAGERSEIRFRPYNGEPIPATAPAEVP